MRLGEVIYTIIATIDSMPTAEFCKKLLKGEVKTQALKVSEMGKKERSIHIARNKREEADRAYYGEW